MLLVRYQYKIKEYYKEFFKVVNKLFFKEDSMSEKFHKVYSDLYFNGEHCGYCTCLTESDNIKDLSSLFSDVDTILYDEFQSEFSKYAPKEVERFISIHTSVARGEGEQSRFVRTILLSNIVSYVNPYFLTLGITERICSNTHFLKGNGFILEQNFNEHAARAQISSKFIQAFKGTKHFSYITSKEALLDSNTFVEKPAGKQSYLMTLVYKQNKYAVKMIDSHIIYIDNRVDQTNPNIFALDVESHTENSRILRSTHPIIYYMKTNYDKGKVRFRNQRCKEMMAESFRL